MTLNVGELVATVRVDDRGFQSDLNRAQGHFTGFGSRLGSVIATGAAAAGTALVSMGALAAVTGIKTAASMEQAEVAFTTLLGSVQKSKAFLSDLSSFAAKTPFELPSLISASRQLLGVGQSAQSVIPTLTALGNTSGALGLSQEQFNRTMLAVTQTMAKGKIQAEELMQITEAGIPIYKILASALGKPVSEIQKLSEQGKLLADDVWPKVFSQMNKDYGGAMEAQAKTLNGAWSTLKDTVSMSLAEAFKPAIPVLASAMPKAAEAFSSALEGLGDGVSRAGPVLEMLVNKYGPRFAGVADQVQSNLKALGKLFRTVFDDVSQVIEENRGTIDSWVSKISSSMQTCQEIVGDVIEIITILWESGGQRMLQAVITMFSGILTVIQGVLNIIGGIIKVFVGILTGDWSKAWEGIKQIVEGQWQIIKGVITVALGLIQKTIGDAWAVISGIISGAVALISSIISAGLNFIVAIWNGLWNGVKAVATAVWNAIVGFISGAIGRISGAIGQLGSIPGQVSSWFWGAVHAAQSAFNSLIGWVGGIPGRISGALGGLGRLLVGAGRDVIDGLLDGIKAGVDKMLGYVGSIAGKIADAKGPREYDLRVLTPNGNWLIDGLERGIFQGVARLEPKMPKVATMLAGRMVSGMRSTDLLRGPNGADRPSGVMGGKQSPTIHIEHYQEAPSGDARRTSEELYMLITARGGGIG